MRGSSNRIRIKIKGYQKRAATNMRIRTIMIPKMIFVIIGGSED